MEDKKNINFMEDSSEDEISLYTVSAVKTEKKVISEPDVKKLKEEIMNKELDKNQVSSFHEGDSLLQCPDVQSIEVAGINEEIKNGKASTSSIISKPWAARRRIIKRKSNDSAFLDATVKALKKIADSKEKELSRDEFDSFGETVAYELRKIKNPMAVSAAKLNIQKLLFKTHFWESKQPK